MSRARRVRRSADDVRIELTPMIDVVFLLLTFFIFAIVMMVRADVLDVNLPKLAAGQPAEKTIPITIVIDQQGALHINGDPVELEAIPEQVNTLREELNANGPLVLAVDTQSPAGAMISLADTLTGAGLGEFSIIGRKAQDQSPDLSLEETKATP